MVSWKRPRSGEKMGSNSSFSSFFSITNLSRVLSTQYISDSCKPFKIPSPNSNQNNPKPPRVARPSKCQKRWDANYNETMGLGIITNELVALPNVELDRSLKEKNIVQRPLMTNDISKSNPMVIGGQSSFQILIGPSYRNHPNVVEIEKNENEIITDNGRQGSFYPSSQFMSYCHSCDENLNHNMTIYIYRGEKAFCSEECREREIFLEDITSKKDVNTSIESSNDSSNSPLSLFTIGVDFEI